MATLIITHLEQPSSSKGWARYRIVDVATGAPVIASRTDNEWLAYGNGKVLVLPRTTEVEAGSRLRLDIQVMLREGQNRSARETIYRSSVELVPDGGESTIKFRPGSQGAELRIAGATADAPVEYGRVQLVAERVS